MIRRHAWPSNATLSSVRPDAPWCPSNLEFIRRINGLQSIADVQRIVFDANYLVLGLGDVYLGAPVATPVDPRHRLVTTKYNPARTWTPENAVGIGGAYLCVYGMEGPGGYQFVGRTVQMWNTYRTTKNFEEREALAAFASSIRSGSIRPKPRNYSKCGSNFRSAGSKCESNKPNLDLAAYHRFLSSIQTEAASFRQTQQEAFAAERCRWTEQGEFDVAVEESVAAPMDNELHIPAGCSVLRAPTTASVWRVQTAAGDSVEAGQRVFILEAMKNGDRSTCVGKRRNRGTALPAWSARNGGPAAPHLPIMSANLSLATLREQYQSGTATPENVINAIYDRIEAVPLPSCLDCAGAARRRAKSLARSRPAASTAFRLP